MFTYITLMIEPSRKLPPEQRAGGHHMLILGGIPGSQYANGPWSIEIMTSVISTISRWKETAPNNATPFHLSLREEVFRQFSTGLFLSIFGMSHFDDCVASNVIKDMNELYKMLARDMQRFNVTVTLFTSI